MTETLDTAVRIACGVNLPLAVSLIAVPKIVKKYALARWSKVVLWSASIAMIISAASGIVQAPLPNSSALGIVLFGVFLFFGGLAFGALLTLVLSGALSQRHDV